jgi:hypothetical protein
MKQKKGFTRKSRKSISISIKTRKIKNKPQKKIKHQKVIKNKGSNAGGKNTNLYGKRFEDLTNNELILLNKGFEKIKINNTKYGYYLSKKFKDKEIIFIMQNGLKLYIKDNYDIDLFRCPDEAYIIKYNDINKRPIIKILEKKEQNVDGSVETKLWCGPSLKREYEIILEDKFDVDYAFCLNSYFKEKLGSSIKKYNILEQIMKENYIDILYGEHKNYFNDLYKWISI